MEEKHININFRATKTLRDEYHDFCEKHGYSLSSRIRVLLEKDMKGEIK